MNVDTLMYLIPLIVSGVIGIVIAGYLLRFDSSNRGKSFIALMLFVAMWSFAYAIEIASTSWDVVLFWRSVRYLGVFCVPTTWLIFALFYDGHLKENTMRSILLLFAIPIFSAVLFYTNNLHYLFFGPIATVIYDPIAFVTTSWDGIGFWISSIYAYACVVLGIGLIVKNAVKKKRELFWKQSSLLIVAAFIPFIGNLLYIFNAFNSHFDPTPILFSLSCLLMALAVFRFQLIQIIPFARKKIFDNLRDAAVILDQEQRVFDVNKSMLSLLKEPKYRQKRKSNVKWTDMFPLQFLGTWTPDAERKNHYVCTNTQDQNKKSYYEFEKTILRDDCSVSIGSLLMIRDVTKRKIIEERKEALAQKVSSYQETLLSLSKKPFTSFDATLQDILSQSQNSLETKRASVWFVSEDTKELVCAYLIGDKATRNAHPTLKKSAFPRYFAELEMNRLIAADDAQGDVRTSEFLEKYLKPLHIISMLDVPIRLHGKMAGVVCFEETEKRHWRRDEQEFAVSIADLFAIAIETKHHKIAEKQIRQQNTELKKIDQLKSQFLNMTSHELRTPITAMKGHLQMLALGQLGDITDEQQHSIDIVIRNTDRLNMLIKDILDTSRLEAGTMKIFPKTTDIAKLVCEVVETMQQSAELKHINLTSHIHQGLSHAVMDSDRIIQVLDNLITNAVKFSPEDTSIELEVHPSEDHKEVVFEIHDHGIGISKENIDKVFQTFYQVEGGSDRTFGGTGLGLTICRGIVISHGGRLWVESKIDKGSVFKFSLPLEGPMVSSTSAQPINIFDVNDSVTRSDDSFS